MLTTLPLHLKVAGDERGYEQCHWTEAEFALIVDAAVPKDLHEATKLISQGVLFRLHPNLPVWFNARSRRMECSTMVTVTMRNFDCGLGERVYTVAYYIDDDELTGAFGLTHAILEGYAVLTKE